MCHMTFAIARFTGRRASSCYSLINRTIKGFAARRSYSSSGTLNLAVHLSSAFSNQFNSKRTIMGNSESTPDNCIDKYACDVNDMKDGEMREVVMDEEGKKKVLLVRSDGEYYAMGPKCTHFGAPLVKGSLRNGHVRCPWHGACFNIKTGDIEDYPGLDCVPSYTVSIQGGNKVYIRADKEVLQSHKRVKPMTCPANVDGQPHYLVIGGGPASVTCVETLRQKSFMGKITIATMESHVPYDR